MKIRYGGNGKVLAYDYTDEIMDYLEKGKPIPGPTAVEPEDDEIHFPQSDPICCAEFRI